MNGALTASKGSILDYAQDQGMNLAESFMDVDAIVLVDTSGSMSYRDAPGGAERYEAACNELKKLQELLPGKIAVIAFSDTVQFCPNGIPIYLGAGTRMDLALRFVKMADVPGMRFILISDGSPDVEDDTLNVARTFTNHIDTVFIGQAGAYGSHFLKRLAQVSGGRFTASVLTHELAATLMLLLEA